MKNGISGIREVLKSHGQRKGRKNGTANNMMIGVKIIPNSASDLRCRNSITAMGRRPGTAEASNGSAIDGGKY
jgi:hypothetical protein